MLYYLLNFNDFASGLITLFAITVINNWYNTTNMLCAIAGNSWPIVYVFSFIVIIVWLVLSLLISYVLEIHGQVTDELEKEWRRRAWVQSFRDGYKKGNLDKDTLMALSKNYVEGNGS